MMASEAFRRRRRSGYDDDDEDSLRFGSRETSAVPSEGPKRQRRLDDDDDDDDDDVDDNDDDQVAELPTRNGHTGSDGFKPGAIVRVKVENFVTYEKAEFFPGPSLNMVIGPNGTGKSSLVCAICLGLGYSPKHLGRAGNVKEFVKHGRDTATIEIELFKRPRDRQNHVIKVLIRREQNNQKWWLNNRETTHKNIQGLMRDLQIQVDNLCQFLPQDRVVEFASCTPIDLLHETLRAAAPVTMLEAQQKLKELRQDQKTMQEQVKQDTDQLRGLENRQQGLQADVDRYREREDIKAQLATLEKVKLCVAYVEKKAEHRTAKVTLKEAERRLRRLEDESGPSLEAVNAKQDYEIQVRAAVIGRKRMVEEAQRTADQLNSEVENAQADITEIEGKTEAEMASFEQKKRELAKTKRSITNLEAQIKSKPPEFQPAEWNTRIRAEEHNLRELEAERREADGKQVELRERARIVRGKIREVQQGLVNLDSQQGQALSLVQKINPDVAKAWAWLQDNQGQFEKEVYGPAALTCSVKDERYSDTIQGLMQADDLLCFTTQSREDHKKLNEQLYGKMGLGLTIRTCITDFQSFSRPMNAQQLVTFGLDGFAVDYLDGPPPVLAMLCAERRLHAAGVSLNEISEEQYDRLVKDETISSWAAGRQSFRVVRRRDYGPGAVSTSVRNIPPARFWTNQPVDNDEKRRLTAQQKELEAEMESLKTENTSCKESLDSVAKREVDIQQKIKELKEQKNALQKQFSMWQALPDKIAREQRSQKQREDDLERARQRRKEMGRQQDAVTVKLAEAVLKHAAQIRGLQTAHEALLEANIRLIEAQSDVQGLKERVREISETLELERANVAAAKEELQRTQAAAREAWQEVMEQIDILTDEERQDLQQQARDKTIEGIDAEIAAEKDKLELIRDANPGVMHDFERRAREIEKLQQKLTTATARLDALSGQVTEIMSEWEPQLDALISRINDAFGYNFEQIGCAGEVRVHKDEDFDLWALEIMVKFRDGEPLQQLNQHRQSGGERAVSTIFYLMALQSMAQSPFQVVDEINQGMDPRNERMVHERMVEIACREHTSQYFLITPKLLTGLRYDPRMRVLCIASGEHMPIEGRKMDFRRCLAIQKRLMASA